MSANCPGCFDLWKTNVGGDDVSTQMEPDSAFIQVYGMFVDELIDAGHHFEAFETYDARMEGWFHGQLVRTMHTDHPAEWELLEVGKKVGDDGGRPDLYIKAGDMRLAVELKSMVIGRRDLMMYFRSRSEKT